MRDREIQDRLMQASGMMSRDFVKVFIAMYREMCAIEEEEECERNVEWAKDECELITRND